jgi:hypothetical protein
MRDNSTDDHAGLTALHASVQKVSAMSRRVYLDYGVILLSSLGLTALKGGPS